MAAVFLIAPSYGWSTDNTSIRQPQTITPLASTAAPEAFIRSIEDYLNTIRTAKATFEQTSPGMRSHTGTLWLQRPGNMRLEYSPPPDILLVASHGQIAYYDKDLDQLSYLRQQDLPIAFLLNDPISFASSGLTPELVINGKTAALTLSKPEEEGMRPVTFTFQRDPLKLLFWSYMDEQGNPVTVRVTDMQINLPLDKKLFRFRNPRFSSR